MTDRVALVVAPVIWKKVSSVILCATFVAGCGPFGDNAAYQRQSEKERRSRIRGMEAATEQTRRGRDIEGEELRALVSGKTHISEYERGPGGTPGPYIEYSHFRPDGFFIYMNSQWALDPNGNAGDSWRVDGNQLCILNTSLTSSELCYRLAVTAAGKIQYYIFRPGDDTDGLLTKIPDRVLNGPPPTN